MKPLFLNLLPPERRKALDELLLFLQIRRALLGVGIFLGCVALVFFGALWFANRELATEKAKTAELQAALVKSQGGLLDEEIRALNATLVVVNGVQERYPSTLPVLREFFSLVPSGITLDEIILESGQKTLTVRGLALNRDDLLAFQKKVTASDRFENPTSPISNLLQRDNIVFDLRLTITST